MLANEQTKEVKVRLYQLTTMFVRKYQPILYYQYKGEQEDLVSDFYIEFLTPKSRVKGKEESLLDKFDPRVTTLEYLVKVAVKRKLIDASRKDKREASYEQMQEAAGEARIDAMFLNSASDEADIDHVELDLEQMITLVNKYDHLSESQRKSVNKMYAECKNALEPKWRKIFEEVIDTEDEVVEEVIKPGIKELSLQLNTGFETVTVMVQQITDKTVCALFNGEIMGINRVTGQGRNKKYANMWLTPESLATVAEIPVYKTGLSRLEFIEKYK